MQPQGHVQVISNMVCDPLHVCCIAIGSLFTICGCDVHFSLIMAWSRKLRWICLVSVSLMAHITEQSPSKTVLICARGVCICATLIVFNDMRAEVDYCCVLLE